MLYKSKILTLVTMVYSWYGYEYCFMGPSSRFYSFIYLPILMIGTGKDPRVWGVTLVVLSSFLNLMYNVASYPSICYLCLSWL